MEKQISGALLSKQLRTPIAAAVTALLLAIGVILHTISPQRRRRNPNWTIAMYSITICLTPSQPEPGPGNRLVAGLTLIPPLNPRFPGQPAQ